MIGVCAVYATLKTLEITPATRGQKHQKSQPRPKLTFTLYAIASKNIVPHLYLDAMAIQL